MLQVPAARAAGRRPAAAAPGGRWAGWPAGLLLQRQAAAG